MGCSGIILCGGRGQRAGGVDKGWLEYQGQPLISRMLQRLTPQVDDIVISANRNLPRYRELGHTVVSDQLENFQGPLAGMAAALPLCHHQRVIVVACDLPELPPDIAGRLLAALEDSDVAFAWDGKREQYLVAALHAMLGNSLVDYLASGQRSVHGWYRQLNTQRVDYSANADGFINVNEVLPAE